MKKYKVALWPDNQSPILIGYFDNKSEIYDYLNAISIDKNDECLFIRKITNKRLIKK